MSDLHPEHVLIVDDDSQARNSCGTFLQRQSYRVSGAPDARGALDLIEQDCPDLVILDQTLHGTGMSGEELLGTLRKARRTRLLPIIMLTVDSTATRFRACMDLGADDFLTKPINQKELGDAVAAQLRKFRLRAAKDLAQRALRAAAAPLLDVASAARAPTAGIPPGYEVLGTLGKGGTATAYLARHQESGEQRVIKVLDLTPDMDSEVVAHFASEGTLLARIKHDHVVRVYEHGVIDGYPYMAMELIAGGTLKQLMAAPWQAAEALRVILRVARGLGAVHSAGVVHRDVKPDNIMLRENGLEPVLLDFGTAKDGLDESDCAESGGVILGTPGYMAPEVIAAQSAVPASDVYACGVMFYELLTGSKPYSADNVTALLYQHLNFPLPQLPDRHAQFQPALGRLLAKDPQDRPRDGREMAAVLAKLWNRVVQ